MLLIAVLVLACALIVILDSLINAPEAYEDEDGFHIVRRPAARRTETLLPKRQHITERQLSGSV